MWNDEEEEKEGFTKYLELSGEGLWYPCFLWWQMTAVLASSRPKSSWRRRAAGANHMEVIFLDVGGFDLSFAKVEVHGLYV